MRDEDDIRSRSRSAMGRTPGILIVLLLTAPGTSLAAEAALPPNGALFPELRADPGEVDNHGRYYALHGRDIGDFIMGNLWYTPRWTNRKDGDWVFQGGVAWAAKARFLLSLNVNRMEAVDFYIKAAAEVRHRRWSARVMLYHRSGHLGDNYISRTGRKPIVFSREVFDGLVSYQSNPYLRFYGGGKLLLHRIPSTDRLQTQVGFELRSPTFRFLGGSRQLVLSQDLQSKEEVEWNPSSSTQIDLDLRTSGGDRGPRVFIGYYTGHSPYGQLYHEKEHFLAGGVGFGI
jgi:hypothetical protein